jgi:hypothetical protein
MDRANDPPGRRQATSSRSFMGRTSRRAFCALSGLGAAGLALDGLNWKLGFQDGALAAGAEALLPNSFSLHGGRIQHHPKFRLLLWGQGWELDPVQRETAQFAAEFLGWLDKGASLSVLRQYWDDAGPFTGRTTLEAVVSVPDRRGTTVSVGDVAATIQSTVRAQKLSNDADTNWIVLLPLGLYCRTSRQETVVTGQRRRMSGTSWSA